MSIKNKKEYIKKFQTLEHQLTVDLERINLIDGGFITVPVRNSKKNSICSNVSNDNKSEIYIEISDDETNSDSLETLHSNLQKTSCINSIEDVYEINNSKNYERVNSKEKDHLEIEESIIYCTFQNKYHFTLRFKATNVRLTFLRQGKRIMTPDACDKMVQPVSKYSYKSYVDVFSNKYLLIKKNYSIIRNRNTLWKSHSNQAVLPPNKYHPLEPKQVESAVSKTRLCDTKGYLYLHYKDIIFELNPRNLTLESFRALLDEESLQAKQGGEMLHSIKSRGTFLGKYKSDYLLFRFDIENINFEQIWLKRSTATQSKDSHTYIKYYSYICNRMTHCAIPLTTYKYSDPMIKIRYVSRKAMFDGVQPIWKKKQRIKRLRNLCKLGDQKNNRIVELNYGSTIQFKTDSNSLCKAKTGLQKTIINKGESFYEQMIVDYQRQETNLKKRENELDFMACSKHTSMEILDYDIISNNF